MSNPQWYYPACLHTFSGEADLASTPSSGTFPASNDALFVPFTLPQVVLISRLFSINGSTASGNIDVGIYDASAKLITSSGSTAQAGTSAPQFFNITDITLGPGRYYFAVAMDNTTGTLFRANISTRFCQAFGMAKQASAFALPSSATLVSATAGYFPLVGAEVVRVL